MYLKACPGYKGKIYLSFVQGYRDENGKVKQKTIEKIGYLDDLKKQFDDPIAREFISFKSLKLRKLLKNGYFFVNFPFFVLRNLW